MSFKPNELIIDQFPVFDLDGYTRKTGETVFVVEVYKNSVLTSIVGTVSEIENGEYKVSFTPDSLGVWGLMVFIPFNKDWWSGQYIVTESSQDDIYGMIRRLLGLNHENIFIDRTVYDTNTQMVQGRVRIFDTKVNCDLATEGGTETTGLIETYIVNTEWEAINQFGFFKQTRGA